MEILLPRITRYGNEEHPGNDMISKMLDCISIFSKKYLFINVHACKFACFEFRLDWPVMEPGRRLVNQAPHEDNNVYQNVGENYLWQESIIVSHHSNQYINIYEHQSINALDLYSLAGTQQHPGYTKYTADKRAHPEKTKCPSSKRWENKYSADKQQTPENKVWPG